VAARHGLLNAPIIPFGLDMSQRYSLLVVLAVAACAAPQAATVAPTPAPTPPAPTVAAAPRVVTEAPNDWQLLDASTDGVPGLGVRRAERELLAGRTPARTVVVAVIDGGADTTHIDLKANLWTNPREVRGNGRDDDANGFVDDIWGWNFLGGRNGENVNWDTLELTREKVRCSSLAQTASDSTRARCEAVARDFEAKRTELQQMSAQITMMDGMYSRTARVLGGALGVSGDSLTVERVTALKPASDSVRAARDLFLRMAASGISAEVLKEAREDVTGRLQYGLNTDFNPRTIVGDNPNDPRERGYGNRDVMGPDSKHGSHVAGIIGAVRGNNTGVDGIASAVRLMVLRAVPNGDERDKDVANAIRYAVDNGAQVINMSFGKDYSPGKSMVDEAVRYADSRGVLLVHAAGNDGKDLAESASFPTPLYADGGRAANWIEVGASSWQGGEKLAAPFSNYGKAQVDVFAPGVDILSSVPGGGYARESGTSMAAPVVSGLAALLMSYFPNLTAADVKRLILDTATKYTDTMVVKPGAENGEKVPFGALSATGGVVNAYAAIRAALAMRQNIQ